MAVESKGSKRKNAEDLPKPKRAKKVAEEPSEPVETAKFTKVAKATKASKATVADTNGASTPVKEKSERTARKRAADFFDGPETTEEPVAEPPKKKKAKKGAKDAEVAIEEPKAATHVAAPQKKQRSKKSAKKDSAEVEAEAVVDAPAPKSKKGKSKKGPITEPVEEVADEEAEDDIDDQTAALLKGFESSEDENEDSAEAEGEEDGGVAIETIDNPANKKGLQKKLKDAAKNDEQRGVVYVGRIPHGFYEPQMRSYFSQFGDITRLRLSRNKKTGASKHYAFIEFASLDVARIVAETMDKYLMFNHILQVRVVPSESVHENLFVGANSRFKAVPGAKVEGRLLKKPMDKKGWDMRIEKENTRRKEKKEKLKAIGYEFEAPELKAPEAVLAIREADAPAEDPESTQKLITAGSNGTITTTVDQDANTLAITGTTTTKKSKKASKRSAPSAEVELDAPVKVTKKSKKAAVETDAPAPAAVAEAVPTKKGKKAKVDIAVEAPEVADEGDVSVAKPKKEKKGKKAIAADVPEAVVEPVLEAETPVAKPKKEKKGKKASATEVSEVVAEPEAPVEKPKKEKKAKKAKA